MRTGRPNRTKIKIARLIESDGGITNRSTAQFVEGAGVSRRQFMNNINKMEAEGLIERQLYFMHGAGPCRRLIATPKLYEFIKNYKEPEPKNRGGKRNGKNE